MKLNGSDVGDARAGDGMSSALVMRAIITSHALVLLCGVVLGAGAALAGVAGRSGDSRVRARSPAYEHGFDTKDTNDIFGTEIGAGVGARSDRKPEMMPRTRDNMEKARAERAGGLDRLSPFLINGPEKKCFTKEQTQTIVEPTGSPEEYNGDASFSFPNQTEEREEENDGDEFPSPNEDEDNEEEFVDDSYSSQDENGENKDTQVEPAEYGDEAAEEISAFQNEREVTEENLTELAESEEYLQDENEFNEETLAESAQEEDEYNEDASTHVDDISSSSREDTEETEDRTEASLLAEYKKYYEEYREYYDSFHELPRYTDPTDLHHGHVDVSSYYLRRRL